MWHERFVSALNFVQLAVALLHKEKWFLQSEQFVVYLIDERVRTDHIL